MKISIIVAVDEKNGIGRGNTMLWHISEDFKRFKNITTGHPIIMGRKTFESIGKPLPKRTNIIITNNPLFKAKGAKVANSLDKAIEIAKKSPGKSEIFIIGGGQIFNQAINLADKLYITKVKGDFKAEIFFPSYKAFGKKVFEKDSSENDYQYTFLEYEK